jgi:hypothetical protein
MVATPLSQNSARLAVLIDGENVSAVHFADIHKAACANGVCLIWRVFGDFSNPSHAGWLAVCKQHGLEAVLQLPLTSGKNAADIAITIAAMDLAHENKLTGLVLVSNDRDFLPLVRRLRTGGIDVHGIGSTIASPIHAGMFTSHKTLGATAKSKPLKSAPVMEKVPAPERPAKVSASPELIAAVLEILKTSAMHLGALGKRLREVNPELASQLGKGRLKRLVNEDARVVLNGNVASRKKP